MKVAVYFTFIFNHFCVVIFSFSSPLVGLVKFGDLNLFVCNDQKRKKLFVCDIRPEKRELGYFNLSGFWTDDGSYLIACHYYLVPFVLVL